jgi:hypothetical protein
MILPAGSPAVHRPKSGRRGQQVQVGGVLVPTGLPRWGFGGAHTGQPGSSRGLDFCHRALLPISTGVGTKQTAAAFCQWTRRWPEGARDDRDGLLPAPGSGDFEPGPWPIAQTTGSRGPTRPQCLTTIMSNLARSNDPLNLPTPAPRCSSASFLRLSSPQGSPCAVRSIIGRAVQVQDSHCGT